MGYVNEIIRKALLTMVGCLGLISKKNDDYKSQYILSTLAAEIRKSHPTTDRTFPSSVGHPRYCWFLEENSRVVRKKQEM